MHYSLHDDWLYDLPMSGYVMTELCSPTMEKSLIDDLSLAERARSGCSIIDWMLTEGQR
jgi:hypothetical protein